MKKRSSVLEVQREIKCINTICWRPPFYTQARVIVHCLGLPHPIPLKSNKFCKSGKREEFTQISVYVQVLNVSIFNAFLRPAKTTSLGFTMMILKQSFRNLSRGTLGWVFLSFLYTSSQSPASQSVQNQRWLPLALPLREDTLT